MKDGALVCTAVLVDARLIVTAASCVTGADVSSSSTFCLAIGGICQSAPAPSIDPSGAVAAFRLSSDALADPLTYGRGEDAPVVGDSVSVQAYDDATSLVATLTATDAGTYTVSLVTGDASAYGPTDLGSPLSFTPQSSGDGTLTTAVYGLLVTLPTASAPGAVYARLDTLASSFLDPLVQGTRSSPYEGCR